MSNPEKDPMDLDVHDVEIEDELDEFNDNEEGLISQLPDGEELKPAASSSSSSQPLIPELPELNRKDKKLREILSMMDDYSPIIPDAVTDYLMAKNGLQINDLNIKRLLALATQKFVSDIAQDAYEYSRIRSNTVNKLKNTLNNNTLNPPALPLAQQSGGAGVGGLSSGTAAGGGAGGGANAGGGAGNSGGSNPNNEKLTLTVEDLSSALEEHGVNIKRPSFYR